MQNLVLSSRLILFKDKKGHFQPFKVIWLWTQDLNDLGLLKPKFKFHLPGYNIYKNDRLVRLVGTKGGVVILVKKGIIVNQEWKNEHFSVIADNVAVGIETETF